MKKNFRPNDKDRMLPVQSRLLLYRTEDGQTRVEVRLQDETVWMTQAAMAELYQTTPQNITLHLKAIYQEGELDPQATCEEFLQVQPEGSRKVSRSRKFYNLPAVLAVGYRVRSLRGTQFRRWTAELIADRADAAKPNMGLTSWKGGKVRRGDVTIAKNYLNAAEMEGLNRIVTMWLDYAEDQAKRHRQIFMRDWRKKLDAFLQFNEREILKHPGKVSKAVADQLALEQYEIFHQHRLAEEARDETLSDDAELKHFLEEDKGSDDR